MPTWLVPNNTKELFWTGAGWDLEEAQGAGTGLRARFFQNDASVAIDTVEDMGDVGGTEIATTSGTPAYTQGASEGLAVANATVTQDNTNDRAELDFDDLVIGQDASGPTAIRKVYICRDNASDLSAIVVIMADLGADKSVQTGDLTLQIDAEGAMYW